MAPKAKGFSRETVEGFAPRKKGYEVRDPGCHGLYLRVMPSGERSWSFRYSVLGRSARVALGLWPEVTVDQARSVADAHRISVRQGRDPAADLKSSRALDLTMEALWERFGAEHVETLRPRTAKGYRGLWRVWLGPNLGTLLVRLVTLAHLNDFKRKGGKLHPTMNRCIRLVGKMLGWAEEEGLRPPGSNPVPAVRLFPEKPKQRFLDQEEVSRLRGALDSWQGSPYPAACLHLILLTGARRSEILRLRWAEVDESAQVATLAEHKTMARGVKRIHLPQEALDILRSLPVRHLSSYVFAGEAKDGTIGGSLDHAWRAIRHTAGLDGVRIHDLRHTYASIAIAEGLTLDQVGAQMGQSNPKTTLRYAHLISEEGCKNAEKVAAGMKKAPGGA